MRNILLTSTAAVCLMLTATAANAQSDAKKQDEIKKEHVQQPSGAVHQQQQAQEPRQQRPSTTGQASEQKNEDTKKSEGETRQNKPGGSNAGVSEKKDQDVGKNPSNEKSHSTEKSEHERGGGLRAAERPHPASRRSAKKTRRAARRSRRRRSLRNPGRNRKTPQPRAATSMPPTKGRMKNQPRRTPPRLITARTRRIRATTTIRYTEPERKHELRPDRRAEESANLKVDLPHA